MREPETCSVCGEPCPLDQLTEFDGQLLCSSCLGIETMVCSRCGRRIWNDDNAGEGNTPLCHSCYEQFYTDCAHCGRTIPYDNAYYEDDNWDDPLCWGCYCRTQQDKEIHEYSYKPEPVFYGDGGRYFGVELEIDGAGEDSGNACQLMRLANRGRELIYPMCLCRYPRSGLYLYASTEEILGNALEKMGLRLEKPKRVEVSCGDILRIDPDGAVTQSRFDTANFWWSDSPLFLRPYVNRTYRPKSEFEREYLDEVKS